MRIPRDPVPDPPESAGWPVIAGAVAGGLLAGALAAAVRDGTLSYWRVYIKALSTYRRTRSRLHRIIWPHLPRHIHPSLYTVYETKELQLVGRHWDGVPDREH